MICGHFIGHLLTKLYFPTHQTFVILKFAFIRIIRTIRAYVSENISSHPFSGGRGGRGGQSFHRECGRETIMDIKPLSRASNDHPSFVSAFIRRIRVVRVPRFREDPLSSVTRKQKGNGGKRTQVRRHR